MPKKPNRPFATIVFSDDGRVFPNIERTDLPQAELELRVAHKFSKTLARRQLYKLTDIHHSVSEPADVVAKKEDGSRLLIQITEIVDQASRNLDQKRKNLISSIKTDKTIAELFRGCRVTLITSSEDTPASVSKDELLSQVESIGNEIGSLKVGKLRSRKLCGCGHSGSLCAYLSIERFATTGSAIFATGGGRALSQTNWLLQSIHSKLAKLYSTPKEEFWLLAYSRDVLLYEGSSELLETASLLDSNPSCFSRVWYFFPYPNTDLGISANVWTSRRQRKIETRRH